VGAADGSRRAAEASTRRDAADEGRDRDGEAAKPPTRTGRAGGTAPV